MPPFDDHDDDRFQRIDGRTKAQRVFWQNLTDQRVANLMAASDLFGDLDADLLSLLRYLGRADGHSKQIREFLYTVKPETLAFLSDLRGKEIEDITAAIEAGLALRRSFRFMRYGVATLFATFVGMSLIWEKIAAFFKGNGLTGK